ncbi:hypothetical protein TIFTF001_014504 [Ficus carica]|uniref:PUM-HD domain-containing protein n=1 Tax=Ficus carica TaxID=3494 RepID=A0AA88AJU4_FICCA|nr:hypothetical protein TIFTF001_014504 [Ficus carica]
MAEKDYNSKTRVFEKMIGDGELLQHYPPSSSSNGGVSPGSLCYYPFPVPGYEDSRFVRSPSSSLLGVRASLPSDHSPSSSSSTGLFSLSDDGSSPYSAALDDTPKLDQIRKNGSFLDSNGSPYYYPYHADNPGLPESFFRMNIGDNRREERAKTRVLGGGERDGFGFNGYSRSSSSSPGLMNNTQTSYYSSKVQAQNPVSRRFFGGSDDSVWSPSHGRRDSNGKNGFNRDSFGSQPQAFQHNLAVNTNSPLRTKLNPGGEVTDLEGFDCEDSFIIEGKGLRKNSHGDVGFRNVRDRSFGLPDCQSSYGGIYGNGYSSRLSCSSLFDKGPYIYSLAKDHVGCRDLQKLVDIGTRQVVKIIFDHVIDHVVELSTNPFGNYLVQKLLDSGTELQKLEIALTLAQEPRRLVSISTNTHGTRVVQKLIETAKNRTYLSLVLSALAPGFLDLTMDSHGTHVLDRCLKCLSSEENAFIFDAAVRFCVEIGTEKNGCCVLQRCIEHSTGIYQDMLVAEISRNAFLLAQDPYGNFVVQFVIKHIPNYTTAQLLPLFKGRFVHFSMQKFSSHVVEKFLECCKASHPIIVNELMGHYPFEYLMQHPFANYGALNESLAKKVESLKSKVGNSPYSMKLSLRGGVILTLRFLF